MCVRACVCVHARVQREKFFILSSWKYLNYITFWLDTTSTKNKQMSPIYYQYIYSAECSLFMILDVTANCYKNITEVAFKPV